MKKISVCKNQQIIFGHIVPTGAVYGKFTYVYDRRVITGYTYVYDKNNRQIFNKNGTPKIRAIIKEVPTKNTVTYSVESFIDYSFKGEKSRHLYAYVLFDNANKWTEIVLGTTPVTQELEKMVREYIKEHGLKEPKMVHVKTKNTRVLAPKFRQANQFDNVFRMRPENTNTINEELKFNTHCSAASNLKKCHSYDERPIISVENKKPEYKRPNEDSKSRTIAIHNYNSNDYVKPETRNPARAGYHYAG